MCEVMDKAEARGEARGEIRGRAVAIVEMSKDFGLDYEETMEKLISKLDITEKQAKAYMEQFW